MYRFDDYRLDPAALHIFRGDVRLDAPPQAIEVLAYLIQNSQRTVGRQELIDRFWPRAGTGADAALNTCIRRIRAMLDDDADEPRYVRTRPRAGYRFVGVLSGPPARPNKRRAGAIALAAVAAALIAGGVWAKAAVAPSPRQSVAIDPVQGLCDYTLFPQFNAGLRESLVAEAAGRLPDGYDIVEPGFAADVHVRTTVRQTPAETYVTLTLVRTRDGVTIWSEEFIEPTQMDDYVPVQRALAERMAVSASHALEGAVGRT